MQVSFLGASWEFLLLTTRVAEKIFPPKNLVYNFKKLFFFFPIFPAFSTSYSHFSFSYPLSYAHVFSYPLTSRRNCSSSYQMSLLLPPADPRTLWTRTVEPWVAGLSSYPLGNNFIFWIFLMNYEVKEFLQKIFLIQVGLELVKLGLLGRRLIH